MYSKWTWCEEPFSTTLKKQRFGNTALMIEQLQISETGMSSKFSAACRVTRCLVVLVFKAGCSALEEMLCSFAWPVWELGPNPAE